MNYVISDISKKEGGFLTIGGNNFHERECMFEEGIYL